MEYLKFSEFLKVDIRVGTVLSATENNSLKKPSIVMEIDFGSQIGIKKSSAQLKANYNINNLLFLCYSWTVALIYQASHLHDYSYQC